MAAANLSEKSNEAIDRLDQFWKREIQEVPDGAFTALDYAKRSGSVSPKAAHEHLKLLVVRGVLTKTMMPLSIAGGRRYITAVYTPTGKE